MSASMMTTRLPFANLSPCRYALPVGEAEAAHLSASSAARAAACSAAPAPVGQLCWRNRGRRTEAQLAGAWVEADNVVAVLLSQRRYYLLRPVWTRVVHHYDLEGHAAARSASASAGRVRANAPAAQREERSVSAPLAQLAHEEPDYDGQVLALVVRRQYDGHELARRRVQWRERE